MRLYAALFAMMALAGASPAIAQDWIRTGTGLGVERVRLAAADFKSATPANAQSVDLLKTFNDTLWNDLDSAGIFDMVSKSFYPLAIPGSPQEMKLDAWGNPPPNAGMVAFGNLGVADTSIAVQGWLFDAKNANSPQVLGKQYRDAATAQGARTVAHKFANEIIFQLGGGIPGIAESKIYFISGRTGKKEVWAMDYDGYGQHAVTHMGSIALSPRVAPDGTRVAFTSFINGKPDVVMYSLDLNRLVSFPRFQGTTSSPAWSADGTKIAFSSSMSGDPEIYVADSSGAGAKRITAAHGPDVSPVFNPKTGAQIAFVSGRSGLPQIFIMDVDGTNPQRITDQGYAVSPSWSPNGQFLTFAWNRHYGPGAPGGQDIYIMDIASRQWVQLTHDSGTNDYPSWAPDGRHIVFQSTRAGGTQIWTMLADGTQQKPLTTGSANAMPNWSAK